MPDHDSIKSTVQFDSANKAARENMLDRLDKVQFTPVEGQVAFIKELVKNKEEGMKFLADPKQYAVDHGILIHPEIVRTLNNQMLFDVTLDEEFSNVAGEHVAKDIVDLRSRLRGIPDRIPIGPGGEGGHPAANAVAAAAVVVAAAAVVEAVVTVVRTKKPSDLVSLQGLGDKGTLLPGGTRFVNRSGFAGMNNLRGRGGIR